MISGHQEETSSYSIVIFDGNMKILGWVGSTVIDGEEEGRISEVEHMKSKCGDLLRLVQGSGCE